jgi:hypothetical protein
MTDWLYTVIPPGGTAAVPMRVTMPWTGPTTTLAPNLLVVDAPLLINPSSGELAYGWSGWRVDGEGTLYRATREAFA